MSIAAPLRTIPVLLQLRVPLPTVSFLPGDVVWKHADTLNPKFHVAHPLHSPIKTILDWSEPPIKRVQLYMARWLFVKRIQLFLPERSMLGGRCLARSLFSHLNV